VILSRHEEPINDTPGPGAYEISRELSGPILSVGVGPRDSFMKSNMIVPPGSYDPPALIPERRGSTIASRKREPFRRKPHAGPIYEVEVPIGKTARKTAFPRGPRDRPIRQSPGPGDYEQMEPFGHGAQISSRMRSRRPMREPERNQMPYYDLGPTIKPSKKSLATRPATRYETESPGPVYDLGTTVRAKSLSIGIRTPQKDPMADIPAPGSYWMAPPTAKPPPIVGFIGPEDRCPVNLNAEAQKPGPGYYECGFEFPQSGRGFKFTVKPDNDVRPDTAAPYQSAQSSLGGPMFTIGLRED
jgi:hypothetical protein